MEIIVKLIEALAWPITVLIIVFVFRKQFIKAFSKLTDIKYKEFEAHFKNDLEVIEQKTSTLTIEATGGIKFSGAAEISFDTKYDRLMEIAKLSPRAAIMSAWFEVENALYTINREILNHQAPSFKLSQIIDELIEKNILEENTKDIFRDLRQLRNEAVHYPEFTLSENEAEKYVDLSLKLSAGILNLKNKFK